MYMIDDSHDIQNPIFCFQRREGRAARATMQSSNPPFEHESLSPEMVISSSKDAANKAVQVGRDAAKSFQHIWSWEDLPRWMQSDPYIRRGYRRQLDSFSACFQSIFYLHNESVNIWSHLLPTLVYLSVLLATDYKILHNGVTLSTADNAVIQTYIAGSIACLTFSVCLAPGGKDEETSPADGCTGLVPYRCCSFGARGDALPEVGLSRNLAERSRMRGHVHLCRPLWQAEPPGFLHLTFRHLRDRRIFRHIKSARRGAPSGNFPVSWISIYPSEAKNCTGVLGPRSDP